MVKEPDCLQCGAVVENQKLHKDWHAGLMQKINEIIKYVDKGDKKAPLLNSRIWGPTNFE